MALEDWMDPQVRERVTALLYELLPELYRVQDVPPRGQGELERFLRLLAAPLSVVRQSVEALHADLFIDSCGDDMLPALADMLGTALVFPDAASNRRELRSTSAWRRRKGTVSTLQALAGELLDMPVTTREGWQRLLVTQHVNLTRPERTVPDVRDALLAERAWGPHETLFRTVDLREATERTSRYHPRGIVHWTHPTRLFPLRRGHVRRLPDGGLRYAFHPLGVLQSLRVDKREGEVRSDLVLPEHFARRPEESFGRAEGFTVRICGLPAAMGATEAPLRQASAVQAPAVLVRSGCGVRVLERELRGMSAAVRLEVVSVLLEWNAATSRWRPQAYSAGAMGGVLLETLSTHALHASPVKPDAALLEDGPHWVPMLRLTPVSGQAAWFPGATVELVGWDSEASRSSTEPELARAGFLRGALVVHLPGMWLKAFWEPQWLHLAADGSVYPGGSGWGELVEVEQRSAGVFLIPGTPLEVGPGAAWPPSAPEASDVPLSPLPSPQLGPAPLHGGHVLDAEGRPVGGGTRVALSFAAVDRGEGVARFFPLLRLEWVGSDWVWSVKWRALGEDGLPTGPVQARLAEVARLVSGIGAGLRLVVRLEGDAAGLVLTPCEVAWAPEEGEPLLLYLPELSTTGPASDAWGSSFAAVGPAVTLQADGSSRWMDTGEVARFAYGAIAPIAVGPLPTAHATLQRRRLRGRGLQPWVDESREGFLDIDPGHGLFALDTLEATLPYPEPAEEPPPYRLTEPQLTVDYQEGATSHVGARPAPREPLLSEPLPAPTRRIARLGPVRAREGEAPVYPSLTLALEAVARAPVGSREVLQFEDSATYVEWLTWEGMRAVPEGLELVLQAAEGQRPVLDLQSASAGDGRRYRRLTLRGLYLTGEGSPPGPLPLPAEEVVLQLCTVAHAGQALVTGIGWEGGTTAVSVWRCVTGPLVLNGPGVLRVEDSVVDAGGAEALHVLEGRCELTRTTVLGSTHARTLDASEALFDGPVRVEDRFQGGIRYSRVPQEPESQLPRRHRLVEGGQVRFVSRDRHHPGHARLTADTDTRVLRGAEDGSELGAFHHARLTQQYEALAQRLDEYTPAGLTSSLLRLD